MRKKCLITGFFLCLILCFLWAAAQEPECDDPPPANFSIPAGLLPYCDKTSGFTYDLMISPWDVTTHLSTDIRISDPLDTLTPEQPRFLFDTAGDRFIPSSIRGFSITAAGWPAPTAQSSGRQRFLFTTKKPGIPMMLITTAFPGNPSANM
jgi:hypothetical protein